MSGNIGNEYLHAVLTGLRFVFLMVLSAWLAGKLQGLFHNHNTFVFIGLLMTIWFVLNELLERAGRKRRRASSEKH
ncbi:MULTISPECIES: hypothetical protein [Pseudomonas]|uniref:Uncharacterized protein n=1 Tax=Pseudomonas asplenii TaxID=53407 RepID=A0A0N0E4H6_9PSED|nr:hypothetical protein [Pseudomonas fuscovaginae]KPA91272.1 hypothetical protein PF66_02155 [Pseudomonas fuscovaginae]KPA99440.1 hypothetical protein PF70_00416 [Pseudomonas fuscovaginae]